MVSVLGGAAIDGAACIMPAATIAAPAVLKGRIEVFMAILSVNGRNN
jgi:hypothetical protein